VDPRTAAGALEYFQLKDRQRREHPHFSASQLDGTRRLALHLHENIPIVPLYFAKERQAVMRDGSIVLIYPHDQLRPGEQVQSIKCA